MLAQRVVGRTQHACSSALFMVQTRRSARAAASAAAVAASTPERRPPPPQQSWEAIRNLRDLADSFGDMRRGLVFRTASPAAATPHDIQLLFNDLGIRDLIDLRSTEELREEGSTDVFAGAAYCRYRPDPLNRVVPDASTWVGGDPDSDVVRVQIPVMEKNRYYYSLLSRMGKRKALHLALTAMIDKPRSRRIAIEEVNRGGLEGLYRIFLEDSGPYFVAALRHIAKSAEAGRPVLFFCKAGKDRTGLLAALLLSLLGASEDAVLADYVRSDAYHAVGLAGLEDNPKVTGLNAQVFERAPREAMAFALQLLRESGGVAGYLARAGLAPEEQEQLRQVLLRPELQEADDAAAGSRSRL